MFSSILSSLPYPIYCERITTIYFLEPLNTISNIGFILSAYFAFKLIKKNRIKNLEYKLLPFLIFFKQNPSL